jgi:hypothetical protein
MDILYVSKDEFYDYIAITIAIIVHINVLTFNNLKMWHVASFGFLERFCQTNVFFSTIQLKHWPHDTLTKPKLLT